MSMIGKSLSHYQIASLIGKGGMGEVYQAKDQKLGRDVAIKVLPEEFARDIERVARFQREAKLLASLNHPNIAAIHGLEESDGTHFLVLELVEGQTLAERIKGGPIEVEEALKLALQIAEALEAAHEKGVIHRDLKPANIKVTPDGKVKVLDFGLAKAFAGEQADLNLSNSPTLSQAATQKGIILGTAAYMSPEQASGETTDKRTDIWAFGVVLFEMLTGRSLFAGENVSQTLARVLERQPDFSILPSNLHLRVVDLLKRCLQKESKNRYHDIADIRLDLMEVLSDPNGVLIQPLIIDKHRAGRRTILSWISVIILVGIIVGVAVWKLKPTPEPERKLVTRFEYELPEGQQFSQVGLTQYGFAVSTDGSQFVYSTTEGFYIHSLDSLVSRHISETDARCGIPFFSPDGQWLGYFSWADNKIKKIDIRGGLPVDICDAGPDIGPIIWNLDNTIMFINTRRGIMRVSDDGGTPELIIEGGLANMIESGFPIPVQMLPDGKTLLLNRVFDPNNTNTQIEVHSFESGKTEVIFKDGEAIRYLPTGHIVYAATNNNISSNTTNLFAIPFDPDKLERTGGTIPILASVRAFALSDSGTLVYLPGTTGVSSSIAQRTLVWVTRDGTEEPIGAPPDAYVHPRISPDGTRVAVSIGTDKNANIWIWDLERGGFTRLTYDETVDLSPLWTSNGKRIAFYTTGNEKAGIYWKAANGTGKEETLGSLQDLIALPCSWTSEGNDLVFEGFNFDEDVREIISLELKQILTRVITGRGSASIEFLQTYIGVLSMEDDHKSKPLLLKEKNYMANAQLSHDGRWIAYLSFSLVQGGNDIYVRPFPDVDSGRWPVSTGGGNEPRWSPDGRELFYRLGNDMMAVTIQTEPTFKAGKPIKIFRGEYYHLMGHMWDLSPDGKRFLMIKPVSSAEETAAPAPKKIIIVTNWFEELKERVPVD